MKPWLRLVLFLILLASVSLAQLQADTNFRILASFVPAPHGSYPDSDLVKGQDGNFYGTTDSGGTYNAGTVFKITPTGVLTTLVSFNGKADEAGPQGLIEGNDGNFYGTTLGGSGLEGMLGTIFKVTPEGVLTTLVTFNGHNGAFPNAKLVLGRDGNFYGTTFMGGDAGYAGTVFKMTPSGVLTTLYTFTDKKDGANPDTSLVQGRDGNFYGTTSWSSSSLSLATIYKITPSGIFTTLFSLNGLKVTVGSLSPLVQGTDGNFYGTDSEGGSSGTGSVFKMTPSGVVTTIASFTGDVFSGVVYPEGGLIQGADGNFYGTTSPQNGNGEMGGIFRVTPAGTLTALVNFDGTNGNTPLARLFQDSNGDLYGTTSAGGASGSGTIFKITPTGDLKTLYSFPLTNGSDPLAGLVQGADGDFYGTTYYGGTYNNGSIFKAKPTGGLITVASFPGVFQEGYNPVTALTLGQDGNFYGATSSGIDTFFKMTPAGVLSFPKETGNFFGSGFSSLLPGPDGNFYGSSVYGGTFNAGYFFKLTPTGNMTNILSCNGGSCLNPETGLILGTDGNFYGTNPGGGGNGSVFKITPTRVLTTLFTFNGVNGHNPRAPLLEGQDGNFYGTTYNGGPNYNTDPLGLGTVFKITPSGALTTLASFEGTNGAQPHSALVQDANGNFYGTTESGGYSYNAIYNNSGSGTIFQITPAGAITTLFSFDGTNGAVPNGLVMGKDGNLYGTTPSGGTANAGVVFEYALAAPAQVITFPPIGAVIYGQTATLNATASSGLPITYSIVSGTATISGNQVTFTKAGTVKLAANQSGSSSYNAAPESVIRVTVMPSSQTITFPPMGAVFYGQTVTLNATSSSGLPIFYNVLFGSATVSGNKVTFTGLGPVKLAADQQGNLNYLAAPEVISYASVHKAPQTISAFGIIPTKNYPAAPFIIKLPVASSGLPVTVSVASGPATISGNTVTLTGEGTVTLKAEQAGNANYEVAPSVTQSFTAGKASQTITFTPIPTHASTDAPFTISATASSGLTPVTFSVASGPATISGNTVTLTGSGTVSIRAVQAGDADYQSAVARAIFAVTP